MSVFEHHESHHELGGRSVIGLHLDLTALRAVEMHHGKIHDWIDIPYPPGVGVQSPAFPQFLKTSLAGLYAVARRASVWVVSPAPSLQVRFLSLPKVRPGQVSNLVYWTFRKEIPFDPAQTVFDYGPEGESAEGMSRKMDVTAYTVSQEDLDQVLNVFDRAGIPLEGIVLPSFAMRNLFVSQWLDADGTNLGLYVGEDASAIMFIRNRRVVAHRVFKTGMKTMLDVLRDRHPDWDYGQAYTRAREALLRKAGDTPGTLAGEDGPLNADAVRATVARLVQQVERSMSAYMVGKSGEDIRKLYVLGNISGLPGMVEELGRRLGVKAEPVLVFSDHRMVAGVSPPENEGRAGELALAVGAALSDPAKTPNLLYTYTARERDARQSRIRKLVLAGGVLAIVGLVASYGFVGRANQKLRAELAQITAQISQFSAQPDEDTIRTMMKRATTESALLRDMINRSFPLAVQNQLAVHTPADIKLSVTRYDHASVTHAASSAGRDAPKGGKVSVEGLVSGEPGDQESRLASYVLRLQDTPLFSRVAVTRSEAGREGMDPVLLFSLEMNVRDYAGKPAVGHEGGRVP